MRRVQTILLLLLVASVGVTSEPGDAPPETPAKFLPILPAAAPAVGDDSPVLWVDGDDGACSDRFSREEAREAGDVTSDNNSFSTADRGDRHLVWNGTRLTLSDWRSHGHDAASIGSEPPTFDSDARIVSEHRGRRRGQNLGLSRDYGGKRVPPEPDGGAHQSEP